MSGRLVHWARAWPARRVALAAVAGLLLVCAAWLGGQGPVGAQEGEREGAADPKSVAEVRISGLRGSLTYGGSDSFTVTASNLTTVVGYDVIVSRNNGTLGIGACGTSSQTQRVSGVTSQDLSFTVHACWAGSGTVTAVVRRSGLTINENAYSQAVTVQATAPHAPARPTAPNPQAREFTAQWQAPSNTGGTALTGYRVVMRKDGASWPGDDSSHVKKVCASTRRYTHDELTPNRIYWFRVKACNGANHSRCSGWSPQASVTLPIDRPDKPTWEAFTAETTQIRVTWSAPQDTGGVGLTGYGLRHWRKGATEPSNAEVVVNAQTSARTFGGLAANTGYRFSIQACNGTNRYSGWTNKDGTTKPTPTPTPEPPPVPGTPAAPHSILSDQIGANSFRVRWSPHAETGGRALTGFGILVRKSGSSWDESRTIWVGKSSPHRYSVTGRDPGTTYVVKIKSCNGSGGKTSCSAWSSDHRVTTTVVEVNTGTRPVVRNPVTPTCPYTTGTKTAWGKPMNLDVTPHEGREITLCWTPVTDADSYTVSATHNLTNRSPTFSEVKGTIANTTMVIKLDDIYRSTADTGLGNHKAYGFKVRAKRRSSSATAESDMIIIIDTPITKADGKSTSGVGNGKVLVEWNSVGSILGAAYSQGEYDLRNRKSNASHNASSPRNSDFLESTGDPAENKASPFAIRNLATNVVYAIQLVYRAEGPSANTADDDIWVFAARDAYAWVSDQPIADGSRVAGVPVTSRVTGTTFSYKICTTTFLLDNRVETWVSLITAAFDRWQAAVTTDLITIDRDTDPCTDYHTVASNILDHYVILKTNPVFSDYSHEDLVGLVEHFIETAINERVAKLQRDDKAATEIKMLNDRDGVEGYLESQGVFTEISSYIGHRTDCWYRPKTKDGAIVTSPSGRVLWDRRKPEALMCYSAHVVELLGSDGTPIADRHESGDVFIRRSMFESDPLLRPASDATFNFCGNAGDDPNSAFQSFLHEAGHSLGIGGGAGAHATDQQASVMNDAYEADCAPHPADIMALYALYQTR